jgi:TatD DNase family protein
MISFEREEGARLLADTHAHLSDVAFADDRDEVVSRAERAGIGRILAVGSDLASSRAAVACAARYPHVYAAVGIHPHEAQRFHEEGRDVERLLDAPKVVAVGEIGLDRLRGGAPIDQQRTAFRRQLQWAAERGLPVSVHNRDADQDVLEALDGAGVTAVLHCFSSSAETARAAIDLGCFLSVAGNVSFPKSELLRGVARDVPLERLLIETDSPVLAPQRWRGRRNEPAYLTAVRDAVAELRTLDPGDLDAQLWANADVVFSWGQA